MAPSHLGALTGGNNPGDGVWFLDTWPDVPEIFRNPAGSLPEPWNEVFGPLRTGPVDNLVVVGQIGQSLDGRIATPSGHSKYINGPGGLTHLHRLRALVDAVVVGVGTALADDPQLTVRRVAGPHPARVVIDPRGRIGSGARVFAEDGVRRVLLTSAEAACVRPPGVELVALPASGGRIAPADILAALAERGLRRILVEGGAETVSRFMAAGCLDRLHVLVAPIILGSGRAGIDLPPIERADQAMRVPVRAIQLDGDLLLDCDLSAQRVPVGRAKIST
jgi:riboflavin-specific deaminase-like protein